MPEGDTIFRAARSLDRVLTGRCLVRFELRSGGPGVARASVAGRGSAGGERSPAAVGRRPERGELVTSVEARGKHLLIAFERGLTLHTHMQMTGSWHVYRPGEPWKKRATAARVVIEVADADEPDVIVAVAVCFSAPMVELVDSPAAHPRLTALGPDLCRPDADLAEAVARLDRLPAASEIGNALLDQRVACGVGNVYKSEVLFACGVDPFSPVSALPPEVRHRLLATAAVLLQANLDGAAPRSTRPADDGSFAAGGVPGGAAVRRGGGLAVYGRAGRPCPRCGTIVRSRRQGEGARMTYWCPNCQADGPPVIPSSRRR